MSTTTDSCGPRIFVGAAMYATGARWWMQPDIVSPFPLAGGTSVADEAKMCTQSLITDPMATAA